MDTVEKEDCADTSKYFNRLQQLYFSIPTSNASPSARADSLRSLKAHLYMSQAQGILPPETVPSVVEEYEAEYGRIVDKQDEKTGLNNFAEGALEICSKHKNESTKWKSTLTLEDIQTKDFYKKLKSQAMSLSQHYSPPGSENIPVFKKSQNKESFGGRMEPISAAAANQNRPPLYQQRNPNMQSDRQSMYNKQRPGETNIVGRNISNSVFQGQTTPAWKGNTNNDDSVQRRAMSDVGGSVSDGPCRKRPLFANSERSGLGNVSSNNGHPSLYKQIQCSQPSRMQPLETKVPCTSNVQQEENNNPFRTAKQQLALDQQKKNKRGSADYHNEASTPLYGTGKKSLGTRRGPSSKFVPPLASADNGDGSVKASRSSRGSNQEEPVDERLRGIDPKMVELITNEIMDHGPQMDWSDIAGLEFAKKTIKEIVVWPMLRPDIFTGLRGPPKGLLLFGPPGTGKTLIGKCIASQSKSTFFSISAASLTSKWVGEGEKMVRALFAVARCDQPAVIFIDEIDSLLSQRSDGEHEATRRIKTEFLIQLDGAGTQSEDRILVIGATNRPQEIDEAARRRFVKRLYIPLPGTEARRQIILNLLSRQSRQLSEQDVQTICDRSDGYSGADMANLCREAALGPVRSIPFDQIETITADQVPPITLADFQEAFLQVRASVSQKDLDLYIDWHRMYGSFGKT